MSRICYVSIVIYLGMAKDGQGKRKWAEHDIWVVFKDSYGCYMEENIFIWSFDRNKYLVKRQ